MKPTPSLSRRDALASLAGAAAGAALFSPSRLFAQTGSPGSANKPSGTAVPPLGANQPRSLAEFEAAARERLSPVGWEYYSAGSADNVTLTSNHEAFARVRLNPQVLTDVSKIDTRVKLFGHEMAHPILLAPTSTHLLAHPEGEVATARGAGAAGATMVVSTYSNRSIEDIARAATQPLWFQLYVDNDRGVTQALIERAEAAGCRALCITVDVAVPPRSIFARVDANTPQFPFPHLNGTGGPGAVGLSKRRNGTFNWKDLEWIQSFAKTPVLLKGILNPNDAERAVKAGVAGIVVSNHGGRALDTVPATIEALPRVTERVAGRFQVLVDGGVRRGTDVLKALAFGASAVLIGRPYLHGLAVDGPDGVRKVIEILRTELEFAMALTGRTSLSDVDASVIWPSG